MKSLTEEQCKRHEAEQAADKVINDIWTHLRREHLRVMAQSTKLPSYPLPKNLQRDLLLPSEDSSRDFTL